MTPSASARPSIGIAGCGFVGQNLLRLFGPCEVYDPAQGRTDRDVINRCRFAFVCVPTPTGPRGECDVSLVEETVRWVESEVIVVRSALAAALLDPEARTAVASAAEWLKEVLADGPMKTVDPKQEAKNAGVSWSPVRRAGGGGRQDPEGVRPRRGVVLVSAQSRSGPHRSRRRRRRPRRAKGAHHPYLSSLAQNGR